LATFEIKGEQIAGAKVLEGKINKAYPVMVKREDRVIAETGITSLKQQKQDISEAQEGMEFGMIFRGKVDFRVGDVILSYSLYE